MNYLIIDDDEAFCSVLSRVLERLGHRVEIAHNGIQAFALCENNNDIERMILGFKIRTRIRIINFKYR